MTSQVLSYKLDRATAEEAFVAGVLHEIGKLGLYSRGSGGYADLMDEARDRRVRFYQLEIEKIRYCTHVSAGTLIGRQWRLGRDILEVIRFHQVVEEKPRVCRRAATIVNLVSLGNLIAIESGFGLEDPELITAWDSEPAQCLGLSEDDIGVIKESLPTLIESQLAALR